MAVEAWKFVGSKSSARVGPDADGAGVGEGDVAPRGDGDPGVEAAGVATDEEDEVPGPDARQALVSRAAQQAPPNAVH